MAEQDPGVPGAVARALLRLVSEVPPEKLERIWIFPPMVRGRTESGVVAAGCYTDSERRALVTVAYRAEETGRGITFHATLQEEGEAPADRLPRVMEGVVQRSDSALGSPKGVTLNGDPNVLNALIETWRRQGSADAQGDANTELEPT